LPQHLLLGAQVVCLRPLDLGSSATSRAEVSPPEQDRAELPQRVPPPECRASLVHAGELDKERTSEDPPDVRTEGAQDALQDRRRTVRASSVLCPPSRWHVQVGQDCTVGPTHAVDAATGVVACGITPNSLDVLDQDWEEAFFIEKCPRCFAAVVAHS
jgi:hypothetical protein